MDFALRPESAGSSRPHALFSRPQSGASHRHQSMASNRPQSAGSLRPQSASSSVLHNVRAMEIAKKAQPKRNQSALEKDWEYLLELVRINPEGLKHAHDDLLKDRDFILQAVAQNGIALEYVAPEFKADQEVVLAAVAQNGFALKFMGESLATDFEFTLQAIQLNPEAIVGATDYWHGDPELLIHVAPQLRSDHDFALYMVRHRGLALRSVSGPLQADKDVVYAAVQSNGMALQYAASRLQRHPQIVRAAVSQNGLALEFAGEEPRENTGIVMTAITNNPMALAFASDKLKNDMSIVVFAAKKDVHSLQFASAEILADVRFMQMIMKTDGIALQYADPRLQADVETVIYAVQTNWEASKYASAKALKSKLVQKEIARSRRQAEREQPILQPPQPEKSKSFVGKFRQRFADTRSTERVGDVGDAFVGAKKTQNYPSLQSKSNPSAMAAAIVEQSYICPIAPQRPLTKDDRMGSILSTDTAERTRIDSIGDEVIDNFEQEYKAKSRDRPSSAPAIASPIVMRDRTGRQAEELRAKFDGLMSSKQSASPAARPQTAPPSNAARMQQMAHRQKLDFFKVDLIKGEDIWLQPPKEIYSLSEDSDRLEVQKKVLAGRPQSAVSKFSTTSGTGTSRPSSAGSSLQQDLRGLRVSNSATDFDSVMQQKERSAPRLSLDGAHLSMMQQATPARRVSLRVPLRPSMSWLPPSARSNSSARPSSAKADKSQQHFGADIRCSRARSSFASFGEFEEDVLEKEDHLKAPEQCKKPSFLREVSSQTFEPFHEIPQSAATSERNDRSTREPEILSTLTPPPLPAFSSNLMEAEACADAVIVGGAPKYPSCLGTYVRTDIESGMRNGGRAIFKGPNAKYLFYWADINKWVVGDDYSCRKGWLCSSRSESYCPSRVTSWKEWDVNEREFASADTIKVVQTAVLQRAQEINQMRVEFNQTPKTAGSQHAESLQSNESRTQQESEASAAAEQARIAELEDQLGQALAMKRKQDQVIQMHENYQARIAELEDQLGQALAEKRKQDQEIKMYEQHQARIAELEDQLGQAVAAQRSQDQEIQIHGDHQARIEELQDQLSQALATQRTQDRVIEKHVTRIQDLEESLERSQLAVQQHVSEVEEKAQRMLEYAQSEAASIEERYGLQDCTVASEAETCSLGSNQWDFLQSEHARLLSDSPTNIFVSDLSALICEGKQLRSERAQLKETRDELMQKRLSADATQIMPTLKLSTLSRERNDPRPQIMETESVTSQASSSRWEFLQNEHARLLADPLQNTAASELTVLISEGNALRHEKMQLREESSKLQR